MPVAPPPELKPGMPLRGILYSLVEASSKLAASGNVFALLANAPPPPMVQDTKVLGDFIVGFEQAASQVISCHASLESAATDCANAAEELRKQASGRLCPICGVELDPDRVVARPSPPLGDPVHD